MKRVLLILIVMAIMFTVGGCKSSKHSVSNQSEQFDSDQRKFQRTFDAEVNE